MFTLGTLFVELIARLRHAVVARVQARAPMPVQLGLSTYLPAMPLHLLPNPFLPALPLPVWSLLHLRLHRPANRIARLHARWRQGTLPPPRPARPGARPAARAPAPQIPESPVPGAPLVDAPARLPRGHGWIIRRIPQAGPCAGTLHDMLQQPDTRAFVAAAPQAGRLLRPLCVALAVDQPPWLRLPSRPRRPRIHAPRPRRERPLALTDPRLGLQPYVIAAARAWRKKDR